MGHVTAIINGRSYRLNCRDGDEERLAELAKYVAGKVDAMVAEFGQVGESRLLALAALMIADELFDVRESQSKSGAAEKAD